MSKVFIILITLVTAVSLYLVASFGAIITAESIPPAKEKPSQLILKGETGLCNDGYMTFATSHSGACSDHGGVKTWY